MATRISRTPGSRPVLCAVLDGPALGWGTEGPAAAAPADAVQTRAAALFEAGVDWIQLRDRSLDAAPLHTIGKILARLAARDSNCRVVINRRVDVAAAIGSGAHLGFDAMSARQARTILGPSALIGASFHSVSEVEAAASGIPLLAYAQLAPIWDPISKKATRPALGLESLAAAALSGLPILAQGGLDPERAREAVQAGAAGVAVTGLLSQSKDPAAAARALREQLDASIV